MHPLDVVKTRFQIQRGTSDPNSYKSLGDCFRTIFRNEGIFGFYKGILPPILAETPKRAVKFFTFEQYKKLLNLTPLSPGLALSAAGLGAGLTEAVVVNPFEVVKVSLQANRDSFKQQPSSFAQARRIIGTDGFGLKGLNKGLTSTLGRHGVFNMIYFGFYFNVKDAIPASPGSPQRVILFHVGLSPASSSGTPTALMSSLTTSINLLFGLPLALLPGSSILIVLLPIYSLFLLWTCPNHRSLLSLTWSPKHRTSAVPLMSSFLILSNLVTPRANLNIFISATSNSASCCLFRATVSNPSIMAGLTTVL
ncbi:mitochondrial 2-oxodicarboxylate carrier isoform X2 [Phyllopteryx taeniolatus]|nr:mitochondrial 2-oxodicarboxylate carrier isoform X2 [Phyllopteryx taeniolatus]